MNSIKVNTDREAYEKELREKQRKHLEKVYNKDVFWTPCMHDQCPNCFGTGVDAFGRPCIHSLSCPCPKCSPTSIGVNV